MKCDNSLNSNSAILSEQFLERPNIKAKEREIRENEKQEEIYEKKQKITLDDGIFAARNVGEKIVKMQTLSEDDYLGSGIILVGIAGIGLVLYQLNNL